VSAPKDVFEEPEEHLDEPPLPVDLRDQFRWKVKPVGHDHRAIDSSDWLSDVSKTPG